MNLFPSNDDNIIIIKDPELYIGMWLSNQMNNCYKANQMNDVFKTKVTFSLNPKLCNFSILTKELI